MIKVIIVDDELHSRETTKMIMEAVSNDCELLGMASNAQEGVSLIKSKNPDLVFLDVQMPGTSGIEMLDLIPEYRGEIIFITAHNQYALDAFKQGALHYLLKPIDMDDMKEAIDRVQAKLASTAGEKTGKWLSLSTMEGWAVVRKTDIYRCESFKNYTTLVTSNSSYTVSKTMKDVENILPDSSFFRIHASHIINIEYIDKVLKADGGNVLLTNGDLLPISKTKKKEFFSWFQSRMDNV